MIATILQRKNDKRVKACLASAKHPTNNLERYPIATERFVCEILHQKPQGYLNAFYAIDMGFLMITEPRKARQYWREMMTTLKGDK